MDRPGNDEPGSRSVASAPDATVRAFAEESDYVACVALQRRVWGAGYACVPGALLKVAQRVGAVAAGAFGPDGELLGFVFGLTGMEEGRAVHWSHMLAVDPAVRDRGIGTLLKSHQLAAARAAGVERIDWTFDPLVARNGYLNVNRFGVEVRAYVPDMYAGTGSDLHSFGTDRLVVSIALVGRRAPRPTLPAADMGAAPVLNAAGDTTVTRRALEGSWLRIRIPSDIAAVAACDLAAARAWRSSTRAAFTAALDGGFHVVCVSPEPDGHSSYILARNRG